MAGPVTTTTNGTTPEHRDSDRAAWPQPWSDATPSDTSAPLEASTSTTGIRNMRAESAAARMVSPSSIESAPRRTVDTERTTMAGRPPSSSTPARIVPATWRRMVGAVGAMGRCERRWSPAHGRDMTVGRSGMTGHVPSGPSPSRESPRPWG